MVAPSAGIRNVAITFSEYELGSPVSGQYEPFGIRFDKKDGGRPVITGDSANPTSPVLAGYNGFGSPVAGTFVVPGTTTPRTTDKFSLDVGYIDDPGSVKVDVYGATGKFLGRLSANYYGINHLVSSFAGAQSFVVHEVGNEDSGFAVDNVLSSPVYSKFVALGDSYSSGEANSPYFPGPGACHSSPNAWPDLIARGAQAQTLFANLACSGARISALNSSFKNQPPQLDILKGFVRTHALDHVTLTLGGNNIGFADVLKDCYLKDFRTSCVKDGTIRDTEKKIAGLRDSIAKIYKQIAIDGGGGAAVPGQLIVVGYPRLFPSQRGHAGDHCPWLGSDEQSGLNDLASQLNSALSGAASDAGVTYVPTLNVLAGHELCTGKSWIHSIDPKVNPQEDGHPLLPGQNAIADAVRPYLS